MAARLETSRIIPAESAHGRPGIAIVDPGDHGDDAAMTVIPIVADARVAAFEVRCRCGSRIVVECLEGE